MLPPLSRDLDCRCAAASWNVANAGVEGLLARPLLVVTVAGWGRGCASSLISASSVLLSRRLGADVGPPLVCSGPFFAGSVLTVGPASLGAVLSLSAVAGSLVASGVLPLGLFADDDGRAFPFSGPGPTEFWRAREDCGRGALARLGEAATLGSGRLPMTGEEAADCGLPTVTVLRAEAVSGMKRECWKCVKDILLLGLATRSG